MTMEIMVFGAGYVGLVQAAGLASTGNDVYLVDTLKDRINLLLSGHCPIFEPGLNELLQRGHKKGNLKFVHTESQEFKELLSHPEIYFIAVGTPETPEGRTNFEYIWSAVDMISNQSSDLKDKIVAVKSTVPVGTGDQIEKRFSGKNKYPAVVSNPEFLKQGSAVQDFMRPQRVIVGSHDQKAQELLAFLHHPFMLKRDRIVAMSRRSAELLKYACNTFLATKISFINEMSQLAEVVGADIREIREGMISDSRIGDQFLFPGVGYGGSCFPKDVHSLIHQAKDFKFDLKLSMATDAVNQTQRTWPFEKLKRIFGKKLSETTIGIWGLAFKPNTDDLREAPSVNLIENLLKIGAKIRAHDPVSNDRARSHFSSASKEAFQLFDDPYQATQSVDALVVITEWQDFRSPNFKKIKTQMKGDWLLDGRNIYDPKIVENYGLKYFGVGIPSHHLS